MANVSGMYLLVATVVKFLSESMDIFVDQQLLSYLVIFSHCRRGFLEELIRLPVYV